MKGLSSERLARHVARALEGCSRIWIAPALTELRRLVPEDRLATSDADVAVLPARMASPSGDVSAPHAPPPSRHRWAVLEPLRIVNRCQEPIARVGRIFSAMGVLEVSEEGLVIVELAPGVSAADVQSFAEPTLKISSRIDVMRDNFPEPDSS